MNRRDHSPTNETQQGPSEHCDPSQFVIRVYGTVCGLKRTSSYAVFHPHAHAHTHTRVILTPSHRSHPSLPLIKRVSSSLARQTTWAQRYPPHKRTKNGFPQRADVEHRNGSLGSAAAAAGTRAYDTGFCAITPTLQLGLENMWIHSRKKRKM